MAYSDSFGAAGLGLQLGSGIGEAYAAHQAGKINRKIADLNARNAEFQADRALNQGRFLENRQRQKTGQMVGAQRAGFAAQGVVVGAGTSADVMADTEAIGEADALQIRTNAAMAAWGYKVQASDATIQGQLAFSRGNSAATQSLLTTGAAGAGYMSRTK